MIKKTLFCFSFLFSSLFADTQVGLLTLGGGIFKPQEPRPCFYIEYKAVLPKWTLLRPQIGALTENFNSLYVYAGMGIDIYFLKYFVLTPSFAPGLYFRNPGTVRLWFPIEFRSSLELARVFSNKARIGFSYFHLSNASLARHNPGVNAAVIFVSFPFGARVF